MLIELYIKWKKPLCNTCFSVITDIFIWDKGNFYCSIRCLQKVVMKIPDVPEVPKTLEESNKKFLKTYEELYGEDAPVTVRLKERYNKK